MFLSIIIPAYNESKRIERTLLEITNYLDSCNFKSEIIVSDDGSTDDTSAIVTQLIEINSMIRLLKLEHKGKGWAVRNGLTNATGTYRFICDADLSMPIEHIERFLPPKGGFSDITIGSREAPNARRIGEPTIRHIMGRIYNNIIRVVFRNSISDTQCGFKCFKWEKVEPIFRNQSINGFAFDMEVLFLAQKSGLTISEIGIDWHYNHLSKVRPIIDPLLMTWDLFKIRWRYLIGKYN